MSVQQRIRKAGVLCLVLMDWFRLWRAWERNDYPRMIVLLEGILARGEDSNFERILLGLAFARQGYVREALPHFERVTRHNLVKGHEALYFNEYAWALYKAGRTEDGVTLLRDAPVNRFSEAQRRWAIDFVRLLGHADPPPANGERQQWGHLLLKRHPASGHRREN